MKVRNFFGGAMLAAVMVAGAPLAASATTLVATETLDLTQLKYGPGGFTAGAQDFGPFSPTFSGTLAAGDSFDYTIKFLPGQKLTLVNPTQIWAYSYDTDGVQSDVNGSGTLTLFDASGSAFLTSNVRTDTEGAIHFGQYFDPSDFTGGLPSTLTFSSLEYVGTINYYVNPAVTSRTYGDPALYLNADSVAIPEPSAWALMIAGLGGLGVALRSRRKTAVAVA